MPVRAIAFDVFGTLVDWRSAIADHSVGDLHELAERLGG